MTTSDKKTPPIEIWDIERLVPYEKNAKKHPEEQIAKLAKSIAKLGIANPLNVKPNGELITGHGRRLALLSLGRKRVPVIVRHDLTDEECDALRISDNQTTSTAYDTELLQESLMDLSLAGFEMDSLGFDDAEITRMTSDFASLSDADDVFVDDVTAAVEDQKNKNAEKEAEIDVSAAPVSDALGFKRVTVEQSRKIRDFMTDIETKTGKQGAEAFVSYITEKAA